MTYDPTTDDEWQEAVDAAHASLALVSARIYGLVTGGPTVHVDRCKEILEKGSELGIQPSADAIERFMATLTAEPRT